MHSEDDIAPRTTEAYGIPLITVIIAMRQAEAFIGRCLDALFVSEAPAGYFEVIVVDDASTDRGPEIVAGYPCRLHRLDERVGPAAARNRGAELAGSELLLFLDADTEVFPDTVGKFVGVFREEPSAAAAIALPSVDSLGSSRASRFAAIRNRAALLRSPRRTDYFTTQMGAVRKESFLRVGGFDESYRGPDIEDLEFGLRLPQDSIIIATDIQVAHRFPDFGPALGKYFVKTGMLCRLLLARWHLPRSHADISGLFGTILASTFTLGLVLAAATGFPSLTLGLTLLCGLAFLVVNRSMLNLARRTRGPLYTFQAAAFELTFNIAIVAGGLFEMLMIPFSAAGWFIREAVRLFRMSASRRPTYLVYHVTDACDSACLTCFKRTRPAVTAGMPPELTLTEIEKFAAKAGFLYYVTLGGGEPFLRRDLDSICAAFYRHCGTRIFSIPTNGLRPQEIASAVRDIVRRCPEATVRVSLSVDAIGERHDEIRGLPGTFEKLTTTYRALDRLRLTRPRLHILANVTASSLNESHLIETLDVLASDFRFDMIGMTFLRSCPRDPSVSAPDVGLYRAAAERLDETSVIHRWGKGLLAAIVEALPVLVRRRVLDDLLSVERTFDCRALRHMVVLGADGQVYVCEMRPQALGDLRADDYDLSSILTTPEAKRIAREIAVGECDCTWECAIHDAVIADISTFPALLKLALRR